MKVNKESLCRGCRDYIATRDSCKQDISRKFFNKVQCPCVICLIKPMCNTPCEPFDEYDKLVSEEEQNG